MLTALLTEEGIKPKEKDKATLHLIETHMQCRPRYILQESVFVCIDALHPSQQFFSHVRTISWLNQY